MSRVENKFPEIDGGLATTLDLRAAVEDAGAQARIEGNIRRHNDDQHPKQRDFAAMSRLAAGPNLNL